MNLKLPLLQKKLYVENRFHSNRVIISLGCDCHPAFLLDTLHLRKLSLPFDWLKTEPVKGLQFAEANIKEKFEFFLNDLTINRNGNVVSGKYPYSEFYHDRNIINDSFEQEKYARRISRFLSLKEGSDISYLYAVPLSDLRTTEIAEYFLNSIKLFLTVLKIHDTLHIYFRYENETFKNHSIFDYFIASTKSWDNVKICCYSLDSDRFGFWGNPKYYPTLLDDLKINVKKKIFPELYFSEY